MPPIDPASFAATLGALKGSGGTKVNQNVNSTAQNLTSLYLNVSGSGPASSTGSGASNDANVRPQNTPSDDYARTESIWPELDPVDPPIASGVTAVVGQTIPTWVWAAGGGLILALGLVAAVFGRRKKKKG